MNSQLVSTLLASFVLFSRVSAHFTLTFPATRGFDEDKEPSFCGGFPTNSGGRQAFPLSGPAPVIINSHHQTAQVAVILSVNPDPKTFGDFNTSNKVDFLMPFGTINGQGNFCFMVNVASLASQISPAPVNGTLATLQVEYNGGDSTLFQCSDLVLIQGATIPSNVTCSNSTGTSTSPTSGSSVGNSSASSSGSPAQSAKSGSGVLVADSAVLLAMTGLASLSLFW